MASGVRQRGGRHAPAPLQKARGGAQMTVWHQALRGICYSLMLAVALQGYAPSGWVHPPHPPSDLATDQAACEANCPRRHNGARHLSTWPSHAGCTSSDVACNVKAGRPPPTGSSRPARWALGHPDCAAWLFGDRIHIGEEPQCQSAWAGGTGGVAWHDWQARWLSSRVRRRGLAAPQPCCSRVKVRRWS
jgi:hypothetical protein